MYHFDEKEIEQQVFNFLRNCGCTPLDENSIVFDEGKIHRFRIDGDRAGEKSGAYSFFTDNWPAGWVCNWRTGVLETWAFDRSRLDDDGRAFFSEEKYNEMRRRSEEKQKKLRAELLEHQRKASKEATKKWKQLSLTPDNNFSYLEKKGITAFGGIKLERSPYSWIENGNTPDSKEGHLVIPLRNIDGEIQSLQFIYPDGKKRFFEGAPVKGAFFAIDFWDQPITSLKDKVFLLCEGYATAVTIYSCTHLPTIAAMNAGNLYPVAEALKAKFPQSKIIIMADNDTKNAQSNVGLHKARVARDQLHLQAVIYPTFTAHEALYNSDWNDFEAIHGEEFTAKTILNSIRFECLPDKIKDVMKKAKPINALELFEKKFEPVNWAVDGFIPSGLTILAGGPKVGKSLLALHLALGVATGGCVLGKINVEQGDVLYLALEDTLRRLQERLRGNNFSEADIDKLRNLDLHTEMYRQDEGGIDYIRGWLCMHSDAKLVIIDTLQKFRKQAKSNKNVYAEDYEALSELKKLADEFNVAIVVLHHLKKMSAREEMTGDWINQISGSMGLSGAADTILLLKRDRVSTHGTLKRTGRDVEEKEFSMKLDGFGWYLEGDAEDFNMPTWKKQIIDYLSKHEKVTPLSLSEEYNITIEGARKQLQRACNAGVLKRTELGVYILA